jgi:mono/diheme cytochrome c family protein
MIPTDTPTHLSSRTRLTLALGMWGAWLMGGFAGCRRAEPPQFTPSAEVRALTDGLDDEEELKLYQGLQQQIAQVLQRMCGTAESPRLLGREDANLERLRNGAAIFAHYCVQCHGVNGDGAGAIASHLSPRPRDYTLGTFKFTSTSNGKARKADLIQTVRRGVTGTSMPSFANFSNDELSDVVDYVLALTHRGELQRSLAQVAFDDEALPEEEGIDEIADEILAPWGEANNSVVMPLTPMPLMTDETVAQGHALFLKFACSRCHGNDGRGGSMGNVDVGTDAWGHKAAAADLTSGMFHGGGRPIDLYRRIYAGIYGSPMPAFSSQFANTPDDIWLLVHFVKDAGQRRRRHLPPEAAPATPMADAAAPAEASATPADASSAGDEAADGDSASAEPAADESAPDAPAADEPSAQDADEADAA